MIYIVSNQKGGSGKSFVAGHILPEHIKRKGAQERVKLFEFDEYSKTSSNYLGRSKLIVPTVISEKDIADEIFNVGFESKNEDVIVDVGAGHLLEKILEVSSLGFGGRDLVFVIPYSDDSSMALLDTVQSIEKHIDNPKIMIVINRLSFDGFSLENAKEVAIDLFGSKKYSAEPSKVLPKVKKYIKAALPDNHEVVSLARLEGLSLAELKNKYDITKELSEDDLIQSWKEIGLVDGEEITREEYVRNMGMLQRYLNASRYLESCSEFFEQLSEIEKH